MIKIKKKKTIIISLIVKFLGLNCLGNFQQSLGISSASTAFGEKHASGHLTVKVALKKIIVFGLRLPPSLQSKILKD
jgi:hypothetical protein